MYGYSTYFSFCHIGQAATKCIPKLEKESSICPQWLVASACPVLGAFPCLFCWHNALTYQTNENEKCVRPPQKTLYHFGSSRRNILYAMIVFAEKSVRAFQSNHQRISLPQLLSAPLKNFVYFSYFWPPSTLGFRIKITFGSTFVNHGCAYRKQALSFS